MLARAAALLALSRGAVAQCTMAGLPSAPADGELVGCADGDTMAAGETRACYVCDYGYTFSGQQPSCTGTNFHVPSPVCQANMCDRIDLDGQEHLGIGMLERAARCTRDPDNPCSVQNGYATGTTVNQFSLNNAIAEESGTREFTCASGYTLQSDVEYVCNFPNTEDCGDEGCAASFTADLCTPVTCKTCTGTASDGTSTCDLDPDTDGTASCPSGCSESPTGSTDDPWCVFVQDETNRAGDVDCSANPGHVWCQCLESVASHIGVSDLSTGVSADWLNDGHCHPIFDTGLCRSDGGDCDDAHTSDCAQELQDVIRPACCTDAECQPVPDTATQACAQVMVPFWERCAYEIELPYLPMWVWAGLAAHSDAKLDSPDGYCAALPADRQFSIRQRCDAHCDCEMLDPNNPDTCSDEQLDSNGEPCAYPDAPTTGFCTTGAVDRVCTCNSGLEIPFEWLCDGANDCGMGEDETASACAQGSAVDLVVWGETFAVNGVRQNCISRWTRDVAPACSSLHDDGPSASSCSAACAAVYLEWYMDCKHTVFNNATGVTTDDTVYATGANEFFHCCLQAHTTGTSQTCASVPTLDSCDGDVPAVSTSHLGNNVCEPALDCEAYLEDAGDCATKVTVRLPFEVTGTFAASDFVSALSAPHLFLHRADISLERYEQTITAELNLGCGYNGAVNGAVLRSPAGRAQLTSGIASWLGIQQGLVSIDDITSSSIAGNDVVNVRYSITDAPKDISGKFSASTRAADLLAFLDVASPQVIPVGMRTCGTHFTEAAPAPAPEVVTAATSVQTAVAVKVEIVETEYELAEGVLAGTDTERAQRMEEAIIAALQDTDTIVTNLNLIAQCTDCVTHVAPNATQLEVSTHTPEGRVIAEFSESELALAVAIIIVLVLGGCVCCLTLCGCTWYWYKRKQKRQVLLIDQAGNILKEWEDEADSAEREVLMSVLHHYIEEQDKATKEAQEREEEELIATLEAYEVIEDAIIAVPVEEGNDLLAAANAEAKAAKKERDAKRKKAQERLAKRRAALLEKKKQALETAGVDGTEIEAILSEVAAAESEADQHRSDLESTLDEKQIEQETKKRTELEAKMAAASTDEERADLQAAYDQDMEKTRADIAAERSRQRAQLNERLRKRQEAVHAKVASKLEGADAAGVAEAQAQIEEEGAQLESEAALEVVDDDTCGQLSAAFDKDAAELKATRDAKKAAARAKLEERRKAMAAKHKRELVDAGAPPEVAEKQCKEMDELAELEAKQLEQQDHVMNKKEAAALAALQAQEEAELEQAESEEKRAEMTAKFSKEQAEIKKKNMAARQKQRSKLNDRLAKRQQQLERKHQAELETVAPEAAQVAEQQSQERAALAELQKKLTATQEELAAEKAQHQAALEALSAKHDEELRMQQNKFEAMRKEFDELAKQKFENVEVGGFAGDEHAAATQAVLGEYQMSLEAATQKTKANKVESKAALKARLEKKRKQMEHKTNIAMQKIAEVEAAAGR